eukprot:TRINITY_DN1040_c0_g1_i1.p1 TRINITY_DN1040_c0_g1~~TRINITY_DN1040_c0_g1_i1.p1  ORF type:complete len:164 (-),score=59.53 TRINITY_DN1040_c0_g1_i1:73-564(-)
MATTFNPPVVWAQRKDQVFLSIDLQDVKEPKIELESTKLKFSGTSGGKSYACDLEFFKEIDKEKSVYVVRPRNIEFVLKKKEAGPYWDHLLVDKTKRNWLKADWNKWVDEDEGEEAEGFDTMGMEGFDMGGGGMPDFSQFQGEGGDSDDEEIPGLEDEEPENK